MSIARKVLSISFIACPPSERLAAMAERRTLPICVGIDIRRITDDQMEFPADPTKPVTLNKRHLLQPIFQGIAPSQFNRILAEVDSGDVPLGSLRSQCQSNGTGSGTEIQASRCF